MSARKIDGPVLTSWAAVTMGDSTHLVGLLVSGHDRLMAGSWIITSPVVSYDRTAQTAVTASTGRTYQLLERLECPPLPEELTDLLARAIRIWRLPAGTTIDLADL